MKKFLVCILILLFTLSFAACSSTEDNATNNDNKPSSSTAASVDEVSDESISEDNKETADWKQFVKEYNDWADEYIKLYNDYNANPTDMTLLTKFTEMAGEVTEWAEKSEKIAEELKNSPKEATECATELLKIAEKLADAVK